jgi:uncharacterized protein (DUF2147 family)
MMIRKRILLVFMMMLGNLFLIAQNEGDKILGTWLTTEGKAHILITKYSDKYGGKIVWLKNPNDEYGKPKVDKKNPDPAKRSNPTVGLNNLLGFTYDGDGEYEDGTIYDPANGKTYKCVMHLEGDNVLKVRGYVGVTALGRTETWTRVK